MWRRRRTATTGADVGAGAIVAEIAAQGASAPIAVGAHIMQNTAQAGGVINVLPSQEAPKLRTLPVPVALGPRDFPDLLGREQELEDALTALGAGSTVALSGIAGAGKTSLLRRLSHLGAGTLDHGVVFLRAAGQPRADVERFLFDAFYEADRPYQPTPGELRRLLADRRALVVLDDVELDRDDFGELLDCAPGCRFLLASEQRCLWGEGHELELAGLELGAALALLERRLGRSLRDDERPRAEELCRRVRGRPMSVLRAAALARAGELPLGTAEELEDELRGGLDDAERRVLRTLELLAPASVHVDDVAAIAGVPDAAEVLERLRGKAAAEAHSPRWTATLAPPDPASAERDEALLRRARERLAADVQERLAEDVPAILAALRGGGDEPSHRRELLALARAADALLASSGRWGAWAVALERACRAAEALGDRAAQAWALHQLGTRAGCLGDPVGAGWLERALALRRQLGDEAGAAVTAHNLALLFGGGPGSGSNDDHGPRSRDPSPGRWLAVAAGTLALGVAAALLLAPHDASTGSSARTGTSSSQTQTQTQPTTTTTRGGGGGDKPAGGGVQLEIAGERAFAADPDGLEEHSLEVTDRGPTPIAIRPSVDNTAFTIRGTRCPAELAVDNSCAIFVDYVVGSEPTSATLSFEGSPSTAMLTGAARSEPPATETQTTTQPTTTSTLR